jgi:hypothetical protein
MLAGNVILNKLLDYFYLYLQPTLVSVFQHFRVVILGIRRLTGGRNGWAGGCACLLHRAQTGRIGHIL